MKINESNFTAQLCRKDERALEYCMMHYGGLVKSIVHRYLGTLQSYEEECINDVFLAVWENSSSYQPERNSFANWIAGISRIKALDCKRKYAKTLLEVNWEEMENTCHGDACSQLQAIEEEFSQETQQMLSCLKPQDRQLFLDLYVKESSLDEISQNTGMSKPVIYNRLSRGKKKIRSLFANPRERSEHYE